MVWDDAFWVLLNSKMILGWKPLKVFEDSNIAWFEQMFLYHPQFIKQTIMDLKVKNRITGSLGVTLFFCVA